MSKSWSLDRFFGVKKNQSLNCIMILLTLDFWDYALQKTFKNGFATVF
jgi:hypothetical protein